MLLYTLMILLGLIAPLIGQDTIAPNQTTIARPSLQKNYQIIVIGGGPSGLTCAQRCSKSGFSTLVINDPSPKNPQYLFPVSNWPGMTNKSWDQIHKLLINAYIQAHGTLLEAHVESITESLGIFSVTSNKGSYTCNVCVLATGKAPLEIPCEISSPINRTLMRFYNTEFLTAQDSVSIIGDDQNAFKIALEIANVANKVCIFSQTEQVNNQDATQAILKKRPNVKCIKYDKITNIINQPKACLIEYSKNRSKLIQTSSWVIFANLLHPNSKIASSLTQLDSKDAIITFDTAGSTKTLGLYACGEVSTNDFLSGIYAAASGECTGAKICQQLLQEGVLPTHRKEPIITTEQAPTETSSKKSLPDQ